MEDTLRIVEKWVYPTRENDSRTLFNLLANFKNSQPITELFLFEIVKLNNPLYLTEGALTTGAACFFGSLMMGLAQTGHIINADVIFRFSSMYMIADHYLDDHTITATDKDHFLTAVHSILHGSQQHLHINNLEILADHYQYIIKQVPTAKYYLHQAIKKEIKSYHLQSCDTLTESEYLTIAEEKGGTTVQAIQVLLGLHPTQMEYELGVCIQLVDDLMDINDDMNIHISTIATHIYHHEGSLDRLLHTTLSRINNLAGIHTIFKPILINMAIYSVTNTQYYTSSLIKSLHDYLPINNKLDLRKAFYHKLMEDYQAFTGSSIP